MANRIGRRRLFGLVGAVAALVAVPPTVKAEPVLDGWPTITRPDAAWMADNAVKGFTAGANGVASDGSLTVGLNGTAVSTGFTPTHVTIVPKMVTTTLRDGELLVSISADTAEFVSALDAAQRAAFRFEAELEPARRSAVGWDAPLWDA